MTSSDLWRATFRDLFTVGVNKPSDGKPTLSDGYCMQYWQEVLKMANSNVIGWLYTIPKSQSGQVFFKNWEFCIVCLCCTEKWQFAYCQKPNETEVTLDSRTKRHFSLRHILKGLSDANNIMSCHQRRSSVLLDLYLLRIARADSLH